MLTKKVLVSVLFAAGMIGAVAIPMPSFADVGISLNFGPPPPRYERVPEPRRGYIWSPGYWNWHNNKHAWVGGVWVREREGYAYQPHRWVQHDGNWNFESGRWDRARGRDSDGDGVPDRLDRHPNNPKRS